MKPRIARIVSAVVLGVTTLLFGLWWFFVRAPGPVEVCEHILQVTLAESRDQALSEESQRALIESTREQCIAHKQDKILLRGRIKYAAYAKCVMEADDLIEIGRC